MKNFISMFLMTSLLLGGMTFTIGKMSVCAASKNRIETGNTHCIHTGKGSGVACASGNRTDRFGTASAYE